MAIKLERLEIDPHMPFSDLLAHLMTQFIKDGNNTAQFTIPCKLGEDEVDLAFTIAFIRGQRPH